MGLEIVELFMEVEAEFALDFPDQECEPLVTIGLLTDYVCRRLERDGRPQARDLVFERVCAITCQQLGAKRSQLSEDTSWIEDLGAQ